MSRESSFRPGILGGVNSPGASATPEEYPDDDAPPYEAHLDLNIERVDRSGKAAPTLPTLMETPSMSSPAATRPRKGTHEVLDPATNPAD